MKITWTEICKGAESLANNASRMAKNAVSDIQDSAKSHEPMLREKLEVVVNKSKTFYEGNKDRVVSTTKTSAEFSKEFIVSAFDATIDTTKNLYRTVRYSKEDIKRAQDRVENQGARYRELLGSARAEDSLMLAGESVATLALAESIPDEVTTAYEYAFPQMAGSFSFQERASDLDGAELVGFVSAVKGKLFELKYIDYLNAGQLPDGYTASLAPSVTQPGWDIAVSGPNDSLAEVLQAKATDSVGYVKEALERYPGIDVVTTAEVYSQLVLSGISDNIVNSGLSNQELTSDVFDAVDAAEIPLDYSPPALTLALIAFTSYKDQSLTLYEKARHAGDRSGRAFLAHLIGGTVAAATQMWWLGLLGMVASRYLGDRGARYGALVEELERLGDSNQEIIDRMKRV